MRIVLIGEISKRFFSLQIEKVYARNNFFSFDDVKDKDGNQDGMFCIGKANIEDRNNSRNNSRNSSRNSRNNKEKPLNEVLKVEDNRKWRYKGKRVAIMFDSQTDITYKNDKKCFSLNKDAGLIMCLDTEDTDMNKINIFKEYLTNGFRVSMGNGETIIGITDYVWKVWQLTKDDISNIDVEEVRFDKGNVPGIETYERKGAQGYYLGRYAYLYTYMYYECYCEILRYLKKGDSLKVLSLGCGAKLDGMGLALASYYSGKQVPFSYKGVDYADWGKHGLDIKLNKENFSGEDFVHSSIEEYLDNLESLDENVVIFPYSISELSDSIENIADNLSRLIRNHDSLFLIINIRENDGSERVDIGQIGRLLERINQNLQDWAINKKINLIKEVNYPQEETGRVDEEIPDYPRDVWKFFKHDLREIAPDAFVPALKKKYIHYRIYRLEPLDRKEPT